MESFLIRYRNLLVLLVVLLVQVLWLAVQVRKPLPSGSMADAPSGRGAADGGGVRLIRLWAAMLVTPFEKAIHGSGQGIHGLWGNYVDLRKVRDENKDLQKTIDRLRLEQATLIEDARQGQRLQALEKFRQDYIYQTLAAQVVGTSGSAVSHVIWLDKGSADGVRTDMAVITPDGIVGKVREVFSRTAQVLMINDQTSGAGVVLEATRIRGILRGNASGQPQVVNLLIDSRIQKGEHVLTAGGDQIFPRGLPVGTVERVDRDPERSSFIEVVVTPAANLQHLDEVLVITSLDARLSDQQQADLATSEALKGAEVAAEAERKRAAAEMAERLPGLTDGQTPGAKPGEAGADAAKSDAAKPVAPAGTAPPPKPVPAKHPDRFSPGYSGDGAGGGRPESDGAGSGETPGDAGAEKPAQKPAAQPTAKAPVKPKPAGPQAKGPQGRME